MDINADPSGLLGLSGDLGRVPDHLDVPVREGPFLRSAPEATSEPVWGLHDGIAVGLWPTPGPRGLLRIYAPYLGHPPRRMINFIAVEPIVGGGRRGLSELEHSARDGVAGKAMWTSDERDADGEPRDPWEAPARGRLAGPDGERILTVFVHVEPFDNGARTSVEVTLREDRPYEVGLRLFAAAGSAPMDTCMLSATMGNYARVRYLSLRDRVVNARELWQDDPPTTGFTPHRRWDVNDLLVRDGEAIVAVATDEADPAGATYRDDVSGFWHYEGRTATQYWRAPADPDLAVQVNARVTYWASEAAIPGGIAFENFELVAPFRSGRACAFGVIPGGPETLGFDPLPPPDAAGDR